MNPRDNIEEEENMISKTELCKTIIDSIEDNIKYLYEHSASSRRITLGFKLFLDQMTIQIVEESIILWKSNMHLGWNKSKFLNMGYEIMENEIPKQFDMFVYAYKSYRMKCYKSSELKRGEVYVTFELMKNI